MNQGESTVGISSQILLLSLILSSFARRHLALLIRNVIYKIEECSISKDVCIVHILPYVAITEYMLYFMISWTFI